MVHIIIILTQLLYNTITYLLSAGYYIHTLRMEDGDLLDRSDDEFTVFEMRDSPATFSKKIIKNWVYICYSSMGADVINPKTMQPIIIIITDINHGYYNGQSTTDLSWQRLFVSLFYYSEEINKFILMNFIFKDHKLLGYKVKIKELHMIGECH